MTKKHVFEGWSWFKLNNLGLALGTLGTNLKFYASVEQRVKSKSQKVLGLIPIFTEVIGGTGRGLFDGGGPIQNIVNVKDLNDNKKFWKKNYTFFSDKGLASSNIALKQKGDLITGNEKLANLFNACFINTTDILQLKKSLSEIISFYENHDSISKIKENNIIPKEFCFKEVSSNEVKKIIKSLNRKKICH